MPKNNEKKDPENKTLHIVAYGMIIFFLIIAISPIGAFGYFNRIFTTMGNGQHIDPISGCPAEPIEYKVMKNGVQIRTEVRWYNPQDAPSSIEGIGTIIDNVLIRSILIVMFTIIVPIFLIGSSIRDLDEIQTIRWNIEISFMSWLVVWGACLVYPLLSYTC